MATPLKYDSDYMNEILNRLEITDVRAIPGTPAGPVFYRAFAAICARLERIERDLLALNDAVRYPDGNPNDE